MEDNPIKTWLSCCRFRQRMHAEDLLDIVRALHKQRQTLIGSDFPLTPLIAPSGEPDEEAIVWLADYLTPRACLFSCPLAIREEIDLGEERIQEMEEFFYNFFFFLLKLAAAEDFFPHSLYTNSLDYLIVAASDLECAPSLWSFGETVGEFMPPDVRDAFEAWVYDEDVWVPIDVQSAVLGAVSVLTGALEDPIEEESDRY